MKKLNNYLLLLVAMVLLTACLSACSGKEENEPEPGTGTDTTVVDPPVNICVEPITKWGCSAEYIKQNEKGKLTGYGIVTNRHGEERQYLQYDDPANFRTMRYELAHDQLKQVTVAVKASVYYHGDVIAYISDNYTMVKDEYSYPDHTLFMGERKGKDDEKATLVGIGYYDEASPWLFLVFMPKEDYVPGQPLFVTPSDDPTVASRVAWPYDT